MVAVEKNLRITAVVPMRHSSERVPGKNYRDFGGLPLYEHIIGSLSACVSIGEIIVDTDSPIIAGGLAEKFPEVRVLERPRHLRDGMIDMNEVLTNTLAAIDTQFVLQTHSTNPLITSQTLDRAISRFVESLPHHDSLFSATKLQQRLWDTGGNPINHSLDILVRTQDLSPIWLENSCIYIFSKTKFLELGRRIGERPVIFETPLAESFDIDSEEDFAIAEAAFRRARDPVGKASND